MNKTTYTYCLVKYVHNPALGEMLNIGVLVYAPNANYFGAKFDGYYERLSKTFAGFEGNSYLQIVRGIENACLEISDSLQPMNGLFDKKNTFGNLSEITRRILPEQGLNIQFGEIFGGLTDDLTLETERIFERAIRSQYFRKRKERRTDKEVWKEYQRRFAERRINGHLSEKQFVSDNYQLKYEHAFKNGKWHLLLPITLDYVNSQSLQERATKVIGESSLLNEQKDFSKLYLLLGKPTDEKHQSAYNKAKNLLNKISIRKEIVEESEAESFAKELESYMKSHGIIKPME